MDFILHIFAYFPLKLNQACMQMQRPGLWWRCLLSSLQADTHCSASVVQGWQQHLDAWGLGREGGVEAKGVGMEKKCKSHVFTFFFFRNYFSTSTASTDNKKLIIQHHTVQAASITSFISSALEANGLKPHWANEDIKSSAVLSAVASACLCISCSAAIVHMAKHHC